VTNIHEAQTHLSWLLERAAGEEIVIAKAGKPVARLVKYEPAAKPLRRPGSLKGKIRVLPGFYEPDREIGALFYGETVDADRVKTSTRHKRSAVVARRK
jgi:prevent-host-death family protein